MPIGTGAFYEPDIIRIWPHLDGHNHRRKAHMTFVKQISGGAMLGVAMLVGAGLSAPPAQAGYIETLEQVGSNVVATGSGTIDLAGLSRSESGFSAIANIVPSFASIFTGPSSASTDIYGLITGPTSFGSDISSQPSSGSGNMVGINGGSNHSLYVPAGYVSESALSDTATYDSKTFASLGVTPGQYVWTWGSGTTADSFTLDIGPVAVPAPAIGQGLPVVLAVGGVLFGARLLERNRKRRPLGTQTA
jgi:hypothetical protein